MEYRRVLIETDEKVALNADRYRDFLRSQAGGPGLEIPRQTAAGYV